MKADNGAEAYGHDTVRSHRGQLATERRRLDDALYEKIAQRTKKGEAIIEENP